MRHPALLLALALPLAAGCMPERERISLVFETSGQGSDAMLQQAAGSLAQRFRARGHDEAEVTVVDGKLQVHLAEMPLVALEEFTRNIRFSMHLVNPTPIPGPALVSAREELGPDFEDSEALTGALQGSGVLTPGQSAMWRVEPDHEEPLLLLEAAMLDGMEVATAEFHASPPTVQVRFSPQGSSTLCTTTSRHLGDRIAVVIEQRVWSAPVIQEGICGGAASITLGPDQSEAGQQLAEVLAWGALPVDLVPVSN